MSKKAVLFKVESEIYKKFKGLCVVKGINVSDMVEKLMAKAVKEKAKK